MTQQLVRPRPPVEDESAAAAETMELVARFQAGDRDAFDLIYRRYFDMVFRFVFFRLGRSYPTGHRQLAEDLTQDVFIKALARLDSFRWQGKDLGAWLVTIARNLVADYYKSGRYRREVLTAGVPDALVGHSFRDVSAEPDPLDAAITYLQNVDLLGLLFELTECQREVLVLRFLRGLSVAETAAAMGREESVVKALTFRAIRRLQSVLRERELDQQEVVA